MRVATFACCALLIGLACVNPSEPEPKLILETDRASYVASADPDPRFDYLTTVIVTFRNETGGVVRINRCTATTSHPPYSVEPADRGEAAWNPDIACAPNAPMLQDVAAGQERTDTLVLRAPWQRLFNGQPVGSTSGDFHLTYEVQICGSVTQFGFCTINFRYELASSNRFTIAIP